MKDEHFRYLGILLILGGLIGMLLVMRGNPVGYAVFNGESDSVGNGQMQVSAIGNLVGYLGGNLNLDLKVKNTGKDSLNNCQLKLNGEMISWINSEAREIKAGETIDFLFNLNIPSNSILKQYSGELIVKCDESSFSQNISINVLKGSELIKINELKSNENKLNVSYSFDRSNFIGENIGVDIWIVNSNGTEIKRTHDLVKLNRQGIIERNILIEMPEDLNGNYLVYLALSDDLNNNVQQSVVFDRAPISGMAISGETKSNWTGYLVFAIIVLLGILFAFKGSLTSNNETKSKSRKDEEDYGNELGVNNGLFDRKE